MIYEGKRWLVQMDCDWPRILRWRRWNWLNVCLLDLTPEWDRSLGSVEIAAGLLGFRARLSYVYDADTPLRADLREQMDTVLSESSVIVPHDVYVALLADADKWRGIPVESLGREHAP